MSLDKRLSFTAVRLGCSLVILIACSSPEVPAPPGDFSLTATQSVTIQAGGSKAVIQVSVAPLNGFSSPVRVSLTGLPPGATTSPQLPLSILPDTTLSISIGVPRATAATSYNIEVDASGGNASHTASVALAVTAATDFSIVATPDSMFLRDGTNGSVTFTLVPTNNFQDSVRVHFTSVPAGTSVAAETTFTMSSARPHTVLVNASNIAPLAASPLPFIATAWNDSIGHNGSVSLSIIGPTRTYTSGSRVVLETVAQSDTLIAAVDKQMGGALVDLRWDGKPLIRANHANEGVQVHFYRGDHYYDNCWGCTGLQNFGESAFQGGDRNGNHNSVTTALATATSIYTKTEAVEWNPILEGASVRTRTPANVTVEQWLTAVPNTPTAVELHYKITDHSGLARPAREQDFAGVFVDSSLTHLLRYQGSSPWTGDAVTTGTLSAAQKGKNVWSTEQWVAAVDDSDNGLTVFAPTGSMLFDVDGQGTWLTPYAFLGLQPFQSVEARLVLIAGTYEKARTALSSLRTTETDPPVYAPEGYLDLPADSAVVSGVVDAAGWAIANDGIDHVDLRVDDSTVASVKTTVQRPDLATVYPFAGPTSGFDAPINTANFPDGTRIMSAVAYTTSGAHREVARHPVVFNNPGVASTDLSFGVSVGSLETVISFATQGCGGTDTAGDVPDSPVRPIHLADGSVLLLGSWVPKQYSSRGASLSALQRVCQPVLQSLHDHDPSHFADWEWITSAYRQGDTVHALVHDEFYGDTDPNCSGDGGPDHCWYNGIAYASSVDNGVTFQLAPDSTRVVSAPPQVWDPSVGSIPYGNMNPTNIVKGRDGYFYAMFMSEPKYDPRDGGVCLMRTPTVGAPASWRAWDGSGFSISMGNPYTSQATGQLCTRLANVGPTIGGISYNTYLGRYLAATFGTWNMNGTTQCGIFLSSSPDLIHWSGPQLAWSADPTGLPCVGGVDHGMSYVSIIDPADTSVNFENSGQTAYLYFSRRNGLPPNWDLVRVPFTIVKH